MPEEGKKDVLDFPLEEVSIPQAIALMMQAAAKCMYIDAVGTNSVATKTDNDRLQLLIEKLEAYVEDKIDLAAIPMVETVVEDAPDEEFESVPESDVFVQKDDDDNIIRLVHKGIVFGLLCNERVNTDPTTGEEHNCIKEWGHDKQGDPRHENKWGDTR